MIKSFAPKGLKRLFEQGNRKGVQPQFADKIELVLGALEQAQTIDDLMVPGFGTHALSGDRAGEWAIVLTRNWRITFSIEQGEVYDVDYEDYH
jgi:proteic killer suppression protein